jgi:hypothetical protein
MVVMGSPHGVFVWENKLTIFRAHYSFCALDQLAKTKVKYRFIKVVAQCYKNRIYLTPGDNWFIPGVSLSQSGISQSIQLIVIRWPKEPVKSNYF